MLTETSEERPRSQNRDVTSESSPASPLHHPWLNFNQSEVLISLEGGKEGIPVDCCPSVLEMIEPQGGRNRDNMYVVLFQDGGKRQRFYAMSCRPDVVGKPCRFMDRHFHERSKCVQKYSYSYAIVQEPSASNIRYDQNSSSKTFSFQPAQNSSWSLDYIRVRSGCSCEIRPKSPKKKVKNKEKKKTNSN